jgi:hypothetical protein
MNIGVINNLVSKNKQGIGNVRNNNLLLIYEIIFTAMLFSGTCFVLEAIKGSADSPWRSILVDDIETLNKDHSTGLVCISMYIMSGEEGAGLLLYNSIQNNISKEV